MQKSLRRVLLTAALGVLTPLTTPAQGTSTPADLWAQSVTLEQQGDYAGALALMPQFRQASKDAYLAELRSGWLNYANKNYEDAARNYQSASLLAPTAVTPALGLANSYIALKEWVKAERAYDQVVSRDPSNYTGLTAIGSLSYARGDYRRAAIVYGNAVANYPEDPTSLSGLAWSDLNLRKKREAGEIFQRLLILSPNFPNAEQGYEAATGQKLTRGKN